MTRALEHREDTRHASIGVSGKSAPGRHVASACPRNLPTTVGLDECLQHVRNQRRRIHRLVRRVVELGAGDSLLFDGTILHGAEATATRPAAYLSLVFTLRDQCVTAPR